MALVSIGLATRYSWIAELDLSTRRFSRWSFGRSKSRVIDLRMPSSRRTRRWSWLNWVVKTMGGCLPNSK